MHCIKSKEGRYSLNMTKAIQPSLEMIIDLFTVVTYGKQHEEKDVDHQLLQSGPDLELLVVRLQGETCRPQSYRTRKIHIRATEQVNTIRHRTRHTE